MAWPVKELAAIPDDLSSIPRTYMHATAPTCSHISISIHVHTHNKLKYNNY